MKWFGCACCPPNVIRTLTGLGQYIYTRSDRRVYQHLYIGNEFLEDMKLSCTSSMPWEGKAEIRVGAEKPFELALRVPGYAKDFAVTVNGQAAKGHEEDGYLIVEVKDGDVLNVSFDMDAEISARTPM